MRKYRIGQIVPSSNVTMETEIPAIFRSRETILPERFTFHSSRMRMKKVTKEELEAMDAMSLKCAQELSDAHVLVASACVQMPSLEAIDLIQEECGIPVTSAAVCTTFEMMKKLGIETKSGIGGELLNGKY